MQKSDLSKIRVGAKWTALGAVAGVFGQLLITLSLAVFLSPAEVGLFAVFLFVLGLGLTLLPLGNEYSYVLAQDLSQGDLRRSILFAFGISIFSATVTLGLMTSGVYVEDGLASSVVFGIAVGLLEAVFLLFSAVLQRGLDYKAIEVANILRQILTLILSLLLLAIFHKVEAAYAGRLLSNLAALATMARHVFKAVPSGPPRQKALSAVSRDMLAKNVLGHISRNAEVVAGSPQLGVSGLGIYDLGRRVVAQPRDFIGTILFKFTYPLFAKISKIENKPLSHRFLRRIYRKIVRSAAFVGFPVFGIALLLADPVIPLLLGPEWMPAIPVVEIFALTAFIQVLGNNIITAALTATGGSGVVLRAEYIILVPRLLAVYLASFHGPLAVAVATSIFIVVKLMWMQYALNQLSGLSFGLVMGSVKTMLLAITGGLVIGFSIKAAIIGFVGAITGTLIFMLLYLLVVGTVDRKRIVMLRAILNKRRQAGRESAK